MRSFLRELVIGSLLAWSAAAELTFVAEAHRGSDAEDISSDLEFVPIPPEHHLRLGPRPRHPHAIDPVAQEKRQEKISYSSNWCGASTRSTPSDKVVNAFSFFTAPDLKLRKGTAPPQFAAAWVGIDGAECKQALLQAGVTTVVNSNGGQSSNAWWQWWPEASYSIRGLPVKPGDWMSVNITATSDSNAQIAITNVQQGYQVILTLTNGPKLCRLDAEWILEDFYNGDQQVPFAAFNELWFVEAAAKTARGKNVGIDGAAMVYMQNKNGDVVCKADKWDNANFYVTSHGE